VVPVAVDDLVQGICTSGSYYDRSDSYHPLFRRLFSDPPDLVTTTLVVAEGHGWFLRRFDPNRALKLLAMIEVPKPLKVRPVGKAEHEGVVHVLRQFSDQRLTLADAVGLHVMTERKVQSCWSTDLHLGLTGVPLAIHQQ